MEGTSTEHGHRVDLHVLLESSPWTQLTAFELLLELGTTWITKRAL